MCVENIVRITHIYCVKHSCVLVTQNLFLGIYICFVSIISIGNQCLRQKICPAKRQQFSRKKIAPQKD